ncbi:glycosyltransferase family 2 protein [Primorskyibacter sp. 2E233]|uniref:glycosyltransferase family 2 protein n=1 Tax=Primorskyibacter sp. 2E233 TaxID=3413431 RepID=UPI003BF41AED
MKICALTMVYRDYWALSHWYAHHGTQIGPEHLFVVAHGADPRIQDICPRASIITIPRDGFENFDRNRAALLNGIHAGLSQVYDWVIRTDADELVCFDPVYFSSIHQVIESIDDNPVLTALGFDLVEMSEDPELTGAPVLSERRNIAFSGHYSKAIASRRAIDFLLHGVRVAPRRLESFPFVMPRGLYLAHLKYANRSALDEANAIRMEVGGMDAPGVPGAGWKDADADAAQFQESFQAKKWIEWERAEQEAYDALSIKPARIERSSVVKTRALKMPFRTELPARFGAQG